MNENEKTAVDAEELDNAPPGADEEAAETADASAEEANENEGGEETAEEESPAENENSGSDEGEESASEDADDDSYDEYDGFYRDASDFEDVDDDTSDDDDESDEDTDEPDDESGDTPSDPEDVDGDEGENEVSEEGEEEPAEEPEAEETPAEGGEASYSSWEAEDRAAIIKAHPELEKLLKDKPLGEILDDVDLFVYMRGTPSARSKYSAVEAFEKSASKLLAKRAAAPQMKANSKAHLNAGKGKAAAPPVTLPREIRAQKHLYPGKTDAEILALYKKFSN